MSSMRLGLWLMFIVNMVLAANTTYGDSLAKLTLKVVDDDGNALTNMSVTAGFLGSRQISGFTDVNGLFVLEGKAIVGEANFFSQTDGYYRSEGKYCYKGGVTNGCYQPWNPVESFLVRRIRNPIPMRAKNVSTVLPYLDRVIGYDLMKGDWISPYGQGNTADINVILRNRFVSVRDCDSSFTMWFPNSLDGMQKVSRLKYCDSFFKLPFVAPIDGYSITNVVLSYSSTNRFVPDENDSYFFRIRTQTNLQGEVVSANYGKIPKYIGIGVHWQKTGIMMFPYLLNPIPNDRNMEFDPAKNIFMNLRSTEQVVEP